MALRDLTPEELGNFAASNDASLIEVEAPNNTVYDEANDRVLSLPQTLNDSETQFVIDRDIDKKSTFVGQQPVSDLPRLSVPPVPQPSQWFQGMWNEAIAMPGRVGQLGLEQAELSQIEKSKNTRVDDLKSITPMNIIFQPGATFRSVMRLMGEDESLMRESVKLIERNKKYVAEFGYKDTAVTTLDTISRDIGSGVTSLVGALGITVLTRSPSTAAITFGAIQNAEIYKEGRAKGLDPNDASVAATKAALFESAAEKLGIDAFFKAIKGNTAVKRFTKGFFVEGVQEGVQQAGEEAITYSSGIRDQTKEKAAENILYSAFIGSLIGGPASATLGSFVEQDAKDAGFTDEEAANLRKYVEENINYAKEDMGEFIRKEVAPIAADNERAREFFTLMQKFDNDVDLIDPDALNPEQRAVFDEYLDYFNKSVASPTSREVVEKDFYSKLMAQPVPEKMSESGWRDLAMASSKLLGARADAASRALGITPKEWYDSINLDVKVQRTPEQAAEVYQEKLEKLREALPSAEVAQTQEQLDKLRTAEKKTTDVKKPIISWLRGMGGIKLDSQIAGELRNIGITPKTAPGLFKKNPSVHAGELDNIPASEFNARFGVAADQDGNGYVDRDWLIEALRDEQFGTKIGAEKAERTADDMFIEELDKAGLDWRSVTAEEVVATLGTDADVLASARAMGVAITSKESQEILAIMEANPNYTMDDAIMEWEERQAIMDEVSRLAQRNVPPAAFAAITELQEDVLYEMAISQMRERAARDLIQRAKDDKLSESDMMLPLGLGEKAMEFGQRWRMQESARLYQGKPSPTFYSAAAMAVENAGINKGDGTQWLATIKNTPGVKQEELEWIGLPEFLEGRKGVTKAEVLQFIENGGVQIEEVTKGDDSFARRTAEEYGYEYDRDLSDEITITDKNGDEVAYEDLPIPLQRALSGMGGETKFSKWQIAGGENYRELLLTLPPKEPMRFEVREISGGGEWKYAVAQVGKEGIESPYRTKDLAAAAAAQLNMKAYDARGEQFHSSHFPEANILAHIRFNERTDSEGNRVLFIEEVQSDWHQAGRKKGYKSEQDKVDYDKVIADWNAKREELSDAAHAAYEDFVRAQEAAPKQDLSKILNVEDLQPLTPDESRTFDAWQKAKAAVQEHQGKRPIDPTSKAVPNAPFKKTWHELAMKRMLRYAAENGFDKLAWTTGEQQAERYDLSKKISSVHAIAQTDSSGKQTGRAVLSAYDFNDFDILAGRSVSFEEIEEYVGKDVAEKLVAQFKEGKEMARVEGLALKVGGEGMKGFYDKILPNFVNKYTKKYGAKVEEIKITVPENKIAFADRDKTAEERGVYPEVHSVTITPELREAVMGGQPLFQDKGKAKGSITFGNNQTLIELFENADPSTILHELGHLFLRDMRAVAKESKRPMVKRDYEVIKKWLGAEGSTFTEAQEEKFARGFEAWLREGKAPQEELSGIFERFKEWLTAIYRSVRDLNVEITDDVRQVFERMLGGDFSRTEAEIQARDEQRLERDYEKVATAPAGSTLPRDTGKVFRDVGDLANDAFTPVSTRLGAIDVKLKHAVRQFMFRTGLYSHQDRVAVKGFVEAVGDKFTPPDYRVFDLALKNRDTVKAEELVKKYGIEKEWAAVREVLDDLYNQALDVGLDMGYVQDYFPRQVKRDSSLEYLGLIRQRPDWSEIRMALEEADPYGDFTAEEQASFVNVYLRGFTSNRLNLTKPSFIKSRQVDYVTPEFNQYYDDSMSTLLQYIGGLRHGIEARKLFGKSEKETEKNIGKYVLGLIEQGVIDAKQEKELARILKAVVEPVGTRGAVSWAKNASYIYLMGNLTSAITQIQDLAFSMANNGYYRTIKAAGRSIIRKPLLRKEDVGIDNILQEFEDQTRASNAVRKVFRWVGLEFFDNVGKETYMGAAYDRLRAQNKKGKPEWKNFLEDVFGPEAKQVEQDLENKVLSENVKYLLFSELSDVQPISLAEMPVGYLRGGNGRVFYMLKTYTVKQIDIYRRQVFEEIASGEPARMAKGVNNLVRLAVALMVMGMASDGLKDLILGRPIDIDDLITDNILKLFTLTKYQIYRAKEEGIANTFWKTLFVPPVAAPVDDLGKDVSKIGFGEKPLKDSEVVGRIPFIGKFYYWWWGGGRAKLEKEK